MAEFRKRSVKSSEQDRYGNNRDKSKDKKREEQGGARKTNASSKFSSDKPKQFGASRDGKYEKRDGITESRPTREYGSRDGKKRYDSDSRTESSRERKPYGSVSKSSDSRERSYGSDRRTSYKKHTDSSESTWRKPEGENQRASSSKFSSDKSKQFGTSRDGKYVKRDGITENRPTREYGSRDGKKRYDSDARTENPRERKPYGSVSKSSDSRERSYSTDRRPEYKKQSNTSESPWRKSEGGNKQGSASRYHKNDEYIKTNQPKRIENKELDDDLSSEFFDRPVKGGLPITKFEKKESDGIRLNRFISNAGVCSRRDADELIIQGKISINGVVVKQVGTKVMPADTILMDGKQLQSQRKVYILLNKPKDTITTKDDPDGRRTVYDLIQGACVENVEAVGRLDRNTTGVLLFTNDGDLAEKISHPRYNKMKIYHVFLDKSIKLEDFQAISEGVELEDGFVDVDDLQFVDGDKSQIGIQIHSGKNHVVKRIFEKYGYVVEKLDRVYFAGLTKKNLPRGKWRFLTKKEIEVLHQGAYE